MIQFFILAKSKRVDVGGPQSLRRGDARAQRDELLVAARLCEARLRLTRQELRGDRAVVHLRRTGVRTPGC